MEEPAHLRGWRTHALLCLPALAAFAPQLLGLRVLYLRDSGLYFLPHKALVAQALREGRLPQWNPYEYGGIPLLADPNFNVFHPLSLLTHLLPLPWSHALFACACALAAAYGARALGRALGLSAEGAIACGLAYAWSGQAVSLLLTGQAVAGCFVPWLVAAAARAGRLAAPRALAEVGVAAALVFVSGTPEVGACGFLLGGLLAALPEEAPPGGRARASLAGLARFGAGCALGALLAAVQLLPSAAYVAASSRGAGFDYAHAAAYSLHPLRLLGLAVPFATGRADAPGAQSWIFPAGVQPYIEEIYLGLPALALCAWGLRGAAGRGRRAALLAGAAALGLLALGSHLPLHRALWDASSLFRSVRFPEKLIVPLALAVAASAGAGWDRLRASLAAPPLAPGRLRGAALLAALALGAGAFALALPAFGDAALAALSPDRRQSLLATLAPSLALEGLLAGAAVLLWILGRAGRLAPGRAAAAVALLWAAELAAPAATLWTTADPAELSAQVPLAGALARDAGAPGWSFRFSSQSSGLDLAQTDALGDPGWQRPRKLFWVRHQALYDSWPATLGLYSDRGYSGFTPGGLRELYSQANGRAVLDLLGVRYGVAFGARRPVYAQLGFLPVPPERAPQVAGPGGRPAPISVWENPTAAPRLRLVSGLLRGRGAGLLPSCAGRPAAWIPEREAALLPAGLTAGATCAGLRPEPEGGPGSAAITRYEPERVEAALEVRAPSLALLADAWAPGWTARVDGVEAPLLQAYGALRGVPVLPGRHQLVLTYRAPGLVAGAWLSLAGLVLLALARRSASATERASRKGAKEQRREGVGAGTTDAVRK